MISLVSEARGKIKKLFLMSEENWQLRINKKMTKNSADSGGSPGQYDKISQFLKTVIYKCCIQVVMRHISLNSWHWRRYRWNEKLYKSKAEFQLTLPDLSDPKAADIPY